MKANYKISASTEVDAKEISRLVNSAYRGESSKLGWTSEAELLDGTRITPEIVCELIKTAETIILKVEEENKIIACVELKKKEEKMYLGMLSVSPTRQNQGIGKILLDQSHRIAQKWGCTAIYMTVISKRIELIDWYKRHGFCETGINKPFQVPDERWGIPKMALEFIFLEKVLS